MARRVFESCALVRFPLSITVVLIVGVFSAVMQDGGWVERWLVGGGVSLLTACAIEGPAKAALRFASAVVELHARASTDALTGIPNLDAFRTEIDALSREDGDRWIVVADLDALKPINDRLGHAAGDDALRRSAALLQRSCPSGMAFRTGGDEFAAILGSDRGAAFDVVRRILSEMTEDTRLSLGLVRRQPGEDPWAAVRRADALLYRSKAAGGGRCFAAPGEWTEDGAVLPSGGVPRRPAVQPGTTGLRHASAILEELEARREVHS